LGCAWAVLGLCLGCAWAVLGLCLGCAWAVLGLCLGCAWAVLGLCLGIMQHFDWNIALLGSKRQGCRRGSKRCCRCHGRQGAHSERPVEESQIIRVRAPESEHAPASEALDERGLEGPEK
jgi:hypothetical protein